MARWETAIRWYEAHICEDLLGDVLLVRLWGGIGSNRHGSLTEIFSSYDAARNCLDEIDRERRKRKPAYWRVN